MKDNSKIMKDRYNRVKDYRRELYHQAPLRIFSFIAGHPEKVFCEREIRDATKTSTGSVNQILKLLLDLDIVEREKKGNLFLYSINSGNLLLKYFKIFENILFIHSLVEKLKPYAYEIVLYGSCARGENTEKSDIDIFIKTEHASKARSIIDKYRTAGYNIKAVMIDPLEISSSRKADEVFYGEVKKGIVLWRGKPAYEEV